MTALLANAAGAQERRPMVVDDLMALQSLGDVVPSPDGRSIAVVIKRAWTDPVAFHPYPMFGDDNADVWILPTDGGAARNVTRGASTGAGYWKPVWSPDGKRLAMLSTVGGDNVRPYLWDATTGRLTRLSERGVDVRVGSNATGDGAWAPLQWVDNRRLLVTVLPPGEQPAAFRIRRQTQRIASEAWRKAALGREPTSSVLESGVPLTPQGKQLLLIDVATRRTRVLAEGGIRHVILSPDRRHVAVIDQTRRRAPSASRLGVVSLTSVSPVRWFDGVADPIVGFGAHPHRWSSSGAALAVLTSNGDLFEVSARDWRVRRAPGLEAMALMWVGERLLVRSRKPDASRADWWFLDSALVARQNLTGDMRVVPADLVRTDDRGRLVAVSDSVLWQIDVVSGNHSPIGETAARKVGTIVWPSQEDRAYATSPVVILRAPSDEVPRFLRVDLRTGSASSLPHPEQASVLYGYDDSRGLAVVGAPDHPDGTFLWTGAIRRGAFTRRIALNTQLARIDGGQRVLIDYRTAAGLALKGLVLLPVGYRPGVRYPLLTWVYPEITIRDTNLTFWFSKNQQHPDNLHLLAGHGYAVLMPSMPNSRLRDEIPVGVLPAIDRVIELGIADPDRIAVAGQSGGGFTTYSLITQTNRFKAAIAINGTSNTISSFGTFSGEMRYTEDVDQIVTGSPTGRWGAAPWADPDLWARNSPITYVDRIQTPLLILHGDIDYVPIQQAEEVFTALTHLGKRVRFVRYWGESHGSTDSPANFRDRWRHIFSWLDTHLRTTP